MSNFLSNYYKTIEVEKEAEKLLPSDQKNINTELVENQDLSTMEQAIDPLLSFSNKLVGIVTGKRFSASFSTSIDL